MSTKSQIDDTKKYSSPQGSENLQSNFVDIPPAMVEDIDRAVFDLFNKDLPLYYTQKTGTQRVPIIFATGERFAIIARQRPIRDKRNALILPLVSIMRSGLDPKNAFGGSTNTVSPHVIKVQLSPEDEIYQRLINKNRLSNSDDLIDTSAFMDEGNQIGSQPGRIATRRLGSNSSAKKTNEKFLQSNLGNNFYEVYELPEIAYVTAKYEITLWTQYVQQMNSLISAIISESHFKSPISFRIETKKGYYYTAFFDESITSGNNFEDFSDDERIVRSTFSIQVTGYLFGSSYQGAQNKIRKFVSAPQISFEMVLSNDAPDSESFGKVTSGDPKDFTLQQLTTEDDPLPVQEVGGSRVPYTQDPDPLVGGYAVGTSDRFVATTVDPFNNQKVTKNILVTKTKTNRVGETVIREIL
jgi:hypothetical protein